MIPYTPTLKRTLFLLVMNKSVFLDGKWSSVAVTFQSLQGYGAMLLWSDLESDLINQLGLNQPIVDIKNQSTIVTIFETTNYD